MNKTYLFILFICCSYGFCEANLKPLRESEDVIVRRIDVIQETDENRYVYPDNVFSRTNQKGTESRLIIVHKLEFYANNKMTYEERLLIELYNCRIWNLLSSIDKTKWLVARDDVDLGKHQSSLCLLYIDFNKGFIKEICTGFISYSISSDGDFIAYIKDYDYKNSKKMPYTVINTVTKKCRQKIWDYTLYVEDKTIQIPELSFKEGYFWVTLYEDAAIIGKSKFDINTGEIVEYVQK